CRQPVNVERLVETQELQCLIIGLTSLWDQTSAAWRHQASRVLKAVSAVATSKNCVRICTQNLLHISADVSGPLLAEVAVAVFSFIRDTYALNPALFMEFDTNNGYKALENILKRCEEGVSVDQFQAVEELLALIASFTQLGKTELKVALCVTNPQPPGFKFDPPLTKGSAVKNLPAFHLLQASLLRSQDSLLCCQLLRTLQTIWERDTANFFLLEWTVQSMTQLAACVCRKPAPVQKLFFSLLEMVVFKLNYIPHETLRALLVVLNSMLAEVLSDWGLLELLLGELRRRAKILRKAGLPCVEDSEKLLTTCMLQLVSTLTLRSIKNTVSVRDLGMVPYIKIFLDEDQYRGPTLCILEQLAEINPEEFMSTAIGALCSSTQQELGLKRDLLQSVLKVLESPNSWDAFRRAGGFTGLLSLVIDMEGALSDPPQAEVWKSLGHQQLLDLLLLTLHILALAVHLHTVNAHHFETGGFYERLAEALIQLGCFHTEGPDKEKFDREEGSCPRSAEENQSPGKSFSQFVDLAETSETPTSPSTTPQPNLPVTLRTCIRLLSYLDQFATGTYSPLELSVELKPENGCDGDKEKPNGSAGPEGVYSGSPLVHLGSGPQSMEDTRFTCDHVILHPGAIRVIMTLLPSVFTPEDPQLSMEVQFSLAHHIQAIVKSEQNRQIMCEGGLISTLLAHCPSMLLAPNHPLHLPVTRILEKLASQAITHADFRKYLCLGDPLMCLVTHWILLVCSKPGHSSEADASSRSPVKTLKRTFSLLKSTTQSESSVGSAIPVHQIISLVSMTSPRTFRPHRVSSSPAFVEFDMSESGYGCLFLPSLATVKGVTADSIPTGGIGGECRGFPPTAGLSFSCWFQINRFSSACDAHPIRLLSVVRHMSRTEQQYICLSISFSACDGCLVISTEEEAFTYLDMMEPEVSTPTSLPTSLRFRCSSMLVPGQWHHLAVVMAKDVKKSCVASAYFNGKAVGTGKMKYIQPFPGQYVSMDPTAVIDVYGLIGTPALWKEHAALVWRVGPSYLFEEALSPEAVVVIYTQGTAYVGNFLALRNTGHDPEPESLPLRLVPEERISLGINPAISTLTTVAQIRDDYNEVDCRLIAKEMGITSRDHSTPVLVARNISQHLSGTARTIGAALVGHFGVRTFTPSSASIGFLYVGGPAVVLSLVAMAPDDSSLYAAVKVLLSVLETNSAMQREMNRINGYKLLAFLLKMKSNLVSHRTFQLVLYLSSSVDPSSGSGCLQNTPAFQALLCNLEVWQKTSDHLDLSVLNHFAEILNSSSSDSRNAVVMHSMGLLQNLLFKLSDPAMTVQKVKIVSCVITSLLKAHFTPLDISRLGLFLVYTLPPLSNLNEDTKISDSDLSQDTSDPASLIWIRNQILLSLCEILNSDSLLIKKRKAVFDALGSDWFLLFLQPHLHPSTLKLGLVLLTHFLSSPSQQSSFREGVLPATLIDSMEEPFAVMDNLRAHSWSYECSSTTCPGFDVLQGLLIRHSHLPQVYEALAALLLGRKVNLDDVLQSFIDSQADTPAQPLCVEAAIILLELVKVIVTQPLTKHMSDNDASWESQLPASVMQFLCLLHNLRPRDPLWASPEFLHALAGVVYPPDSLEVCVLLWICETVLISLVLFTGLFTSFRVWLNCQSERPEGQMGTLIENVVLFSKMLLQKLYSGTFLGDSETLLNFLADQIVVVRQTHKTVLALYSCTNKVLLYFLSQPRHSQEEKEGVIRALQTFMERWDVVMATYNSNVNFITCLLRCLLLIRSGSYPEGFGCVAQKVHNRKASSYLFVYGSPGSWKCVCAPDDRELVSLVEACWSKVMMERQHTLEETYKIEISASHTAETQSVSMTDISPLWEETAHKWVLDVSSMGKCVCFITEPKILCEVGAEAKEDEEEGGQDCDRLTFFPVLNETPAVTEGPPDPLTPEPCSHTQDCPDIRIILQELHPAAEVKAKMCVVMVSGLKVTEGVLLFGKESLLLCEGFTLSPAGDVCSDIICVPFFPAKLPSARCRRWLYEDIKEARFMRFLLEDNAIEVFMKNGLSAFLVFLNRDHVSAYKRYQIYIKWMLSYFFILSVLQRGEISNFEYLMHLNTIAGRTYNDLMQYPVYPWVLADYQSETLNLSNPATFRDLSKPMGAQTEKRRQMFIQRYEEVGNIEGEDLSARCHYCTHYSSAIIVASFLVRMEPFSHTFRTLQGGFDIPERMFYSIKKEWESASRDNMGDVRELVPEFFYLPDFLVNSNHIQLGCMEDGTTLGDVELPPWAKDDPQEFIRVHREALESDYVSSHLHLWIDLIFGYRQQGPAAVESVNMFHPYFYAQRGRQGAKDPIIKSTILGYVSNFGQVPKQLFTKPHPPRSGSKKEGSSPPHPTPFFFKLDKLKTTAHNTVNLSAELPRGPVGQILCLEKEVIVLEKNRLLLSPVSGCFFSWGFPDNSCCHKYQLFIVLLQVFAVCESLCDWGEMLCAACPNSTTIVTAGTSTVVCVWDVAVNKDKVTHMKLRQPLYGHTDSVTCLAVSEVHSMIVSGSHDLTCILWDMEELSYITQLAGHTTSISALAINDLTGEIASCAGPVLYLWTMKGQLLTCTDTSSGPQPDVLCVSFTQRHEWDAKNAIVTGCADGIIRIWKTEYTGTQLPGPPEEPVSPGQDRTERDGNVTDSRIGYAYRYCIYNNTDDGSG
uniref:WDFY family member 4 n=1 Tax=Dicentrarchus labrax TaxID=13489 RepID=A0A8C4GFJ4_DICLA